MNGKSLIWCIVGILALSLCVAGSVWLLYSDIPEDALRREIPVVQQTDKQQTDKQQTDKQQTDKPAVSAEPSRRKDSDGTFSAVVKMLGRNYYMRQDAGNVLHASDKDGKEFWSLQLKAPIDTAVCVVDFYSNGKEQFLFLSGGELYLVDRLGRVVEDFPKKATGINK